MILILLIIIAFVAGMITMDYMYYRKMNPSNMKYLDYVKNWFKSKFNTKDS